MLSFKHISGLFSLAVLVVTATLTEKAQRDPKDTFHFFPTALADTPHFEGGGEGGESCEGCGGGEGEGEGEGC
jgi:hypothetical protein